MGTSVHPPYRTDVDTVRSAFASGRTPFDGWSLDELGALGRLLAWAATR